MDVSFDIVSIGKSPEGHSIETRITIHLFLVNVLKKAVGYTPRLSRIVRNIEYYVTAEELCMPSRNKIYLVGLTGGIGAGKSTIGAMFARKNIPVFDLDEIGRELIRQPRIAKKINALCKIAGKRFNSQEIRQIIFSSISIRKKVEKYLHPLIWNKFIQRLRTLKNKKLAIIEAALLIESGLYKDFDELIVVFAPKTIRLKRIQARDKCSKKAVDEIMTIQIPPSKAKKSATTVISGALPRYVLEQKLTHIIRTWQEKGVL